MRNAALLSVPSRLTARQIHKDAPATQDAGLHSPTSMTRSALLASTGRVVSDRFRALAAHLGPAVPLPAEGATLARWSVLAAIAADDLSLARLFEGHVDALSILHEMGATDHIEGGSTWGVWAAEARDRVEIGARGGHQVVLSGTKHWCSGAPFLSHALVTAWRGGDGPFLVAVPLRQAGVSVEQGQWAAIGMADSESLDVALADAAGTIIGNAGDYLERPGFWHGALGVAACWYGGATAVGEIVREHTPAHADPIRAAHLGAIDASLAEAGDVLRAAAAWVDAHPAANARHHALRLRWSVESACETVLHHAGRALGASAYCLNASFARLAADLPVYLRQSHAEHDLSVLGAAAKAREPGTWAL